MRVSGCGELFFYEVYVWRGKLSFWFEMAFSWS